MCFFRKYRRLAAGGPTATWTMALGWTGHALPLPEPASRPVRPTDRDRWRAK